MILRPDIQEPVSRNCPTLAIGNSGVDKVNLHSSPLNVLGLVVRQGMFRLLIAVVAAAATAFAVTRLAASQLVHEHHFFRLADRCCHCCWNFSINSCISGTSRSGWRSTLTAQFRRSKGIPHIILRSDSAGGPPG